MHMLYPRYTIIRLNFGTVWRVWYFGTVWRVWYFCFSFYL